jgi:hypothetical protein
MRPPSNVDGGGLPDSIVGQIIEEMFSTDIDLRTASSAALLQCGLRPSGSLNKDEPAASAGEFVNRGWHTSRSGTNPIANRVAITLDGKALKAFPQVATQYSRISSDIIARYTRCRARWKAHKGRRLRSIDRH